MGTLKKKLEYLAETKEQLKAVAAANGLAVDDTTPFRECAQLIGEKLDVYERYFRAACGSSFEDFEPYENSEGKREITVETRGIKYTVDDSYFCFIYPCMKLDSMKSSTNSFADITPQHTAIYMWKKSVVDYSRLSADAAIRIEDSRAESNCPVFFAFPERCILNNPALLFAANAEVFSQGLSFGKSISSMSASTIYYSMLNFPDKPVYVMEGFTGNLYLAKLNISAEHLRGIINNLGTGSYTLNVGDHNIAKLTAEEIAIATEKGWKVT